MANGVFHNDEILKQRLIRIYFSSSVDHEINSWTKVQNASQFIVIFLLLLSARRESIMKWMKALLPEVG